MFGAELENFATGNAISGATGEAPGQFMVQPPYANMSSAKEVFVPSTLDQVQDLPLDHVTLCRHDPAVACFVFEMADRRHSRAVQCFGASFIAAGLVN